MANAMATNTPTAAVSFNTLTIKAIATTKATNT